jgi:hypothetical protein
MQHIFLKFITILKYLKHIFEIKGAYAPGEKHLVHLCVSSLRACLDSDLACPAKFGS